MRRNFDLSMGLVAIGAVAVLVSLFLNWYDPGLTAWDAFEVVDWALAALAVGALMVIAGEATATVPPARRLTWICGIVALLVVAELLDPPPAARGAAREVGAWIALAGSAVMVAGAVLSMARISVTIDVAERERRRRTAAVDARGGDAGAGGPESPAAGGLWKGARRASETEAPTGTGATGSGGGASGGPAAEPGAPIDDPDRTQPLPRADRSGDEG